MFANAHGTHFVEPPRIELGSITFRILPGYSHKPVGAFCSQVPLTRLRLTPLAQMHPVGLHLFCGIVLRVYPNSGCVSIRPHNVETCRPLGAGGGGIGFKPAFPQLTIALSRVDLRLFPFQARVSSVGLEPTFSRLGGE